LHEVINCSIIQSKCNQNELKIPIISINSIPLVDFDQSIQVELIFLIVLLVDNSALLNPLLHASKAHFEQRDGERFSTALLPHTDGY
jgi:hypothetical protein